MSEINSGESGESKYPKRIQLPMEGDVWVDDFNEWRKISGAETDGQAVQKAIQICLALEKMKRQGYEIAAVDAQGKATRIETLDEAFNRMVLG